MSTANRYEDRIRRNLVLMRKRSRRIKGLEWGNRMPLLKINSFFFGWFASLGHKKRGKGTMAVEGVQKVKVKY